MLPLSPEKARIFRITHIDNLPWTLAHGIQCRSSGLADPGYRNIGNRELIEKRATRTVEVGPGGRLSDYVPFYFTSRSPMLFNIKTGMGVPAVSMREIAILVTSLPTLVSMEIPFVFTDRHAYMRNAIYSTDLADLGMIDWEILKRGDFQRDDDYLDKKDRYMAEALVHRHLPIESLTGIICYSPEAEIDVRGLVEQAGFSTPVVTNTKYFF